MLERYDFLMNRIQEGNHFLKLFSISFDHMEIGYVKAAVQVTEQLNNPFGSIHGGCLFTLADSIAGTAAMTHGRYVTTISGNIHYLNPAADVEKLYVVAQEIKAGRTILTYDVSIIDEGENTICRATLEYFALDEIKMTDENMK